MATTVILNNHVVGPYEISELLGAGGMASVYRAYQPGLKRYVALKLFANSGKVGDGFDKRFTREAAIVASLEHPHIVPIYDFGSTGQLLYVAMRLLSGGTLADQIAERQRKQQPYTPQEVSALLTPIADAIDYAHSKGFVHRDIKPANIMFDEQGRPYLVDFGIARLINPNISMTVTGGIIGTPPYMPPEQWKGHDITAASDIYSLGVTVFEMLTLQRPFVPPVPTNPFSLMHLHVNEPPPLVHNVTPNLSAEIGFAVNQSLRKNEAERYPSATSFAQSFNKAAQDTSSRLVLLQRADSHTSSPALHDTTTPLDALKERQRRKRRALRIALGVVLLSLLGAGGFWIVFHDRPLLLVQAVETATVTSSSTTTATATPTLTATSLTVSSPERIATEPLLEATFADKYSPAVKNPTPTATIPEPTYSSVPAQSTHAPAQSSGVPTQSTGANAQSTPQPTDASSLPIPLPTIPIVSTISGLLGG